MEEKSNISLVRSFFASQRNTPLELIEDKIIKEKEISLFIKRDDLLNLHINGNKWFKLKYNLIEAAEKNHNLLLTFGGAYSNHIASFSYACKLFGFDGIVVVRGEEYQSLNPTLSFVKNNGVRIHYVSREKYRNKYSDELIYHLKNIYGEFFLIPEGGSNNLAVKGCSEIISNLNIDFDFICTACGTAGTLTGIAKSLKENQKAVGVAVLKNASFLNDEVKRLSHNQKLNYEILLDYHFGGYAKFNQELIDFISDFYTKHKIILDPIYTGKLVYAVYDLIKKDYFPKNSKIVLFHSGGLQGYQGLIKKQPLLHLYNRFNWSEYEKQFIHQ